MPCRAKNSRCESSLVTSPLEKEKEANQLRSGIWWRTSTSTPPLVVSNRWPRLSLKRKQQIVYMTSAFQVIAFWLSFLLNRRKLTTHNFRISYWVQPWVIQLTQVFLEPSPEYGFVLGLSSWNSVHMWTIYHDISRKPSQPVLLYEHILKNFIKEVRRGEPGQPGSQRLFFVYLFFGKWQPPEQDFV